MKNFKQDRGSRFNRDSYSPDRKPPMMYQATCSNCGKPCEVPFRPMKGKPVYCKDCYGLKDGEPKSDRFIGKAIATRAEKRSEGNTELKDQLKLVNEKLDTLIALIGKTLGK
jgi:CxxC-x17-CxxC domain-containing protein